MNQENGEVFQHINPINKIIILTYFLNLEILNKFDINFQ